MRRFLSAFALVLVASAAPALAQSDLPANVTIDADSTFDKDIAEGIRLLNGGKPAEAERVFSRIIAGYEARYKGAALYRCTYAEQADATYKHANKELRGRNFVLGGDTWCTALWGKGFVLIDLKRNAEARPFLARSVEMMPLNGHFINEYAEWYKSNRDWARSYDLFRAAFDTTSKDPKGMDRTIAARALRGMAFNLIETGQYDEAERKLQQSLEYQPEAASKVKAELDYIAEQRKKK